MSQKLLNKLHKCIYILSIVALVLWAGYVEASSEMSPSCEKLGSKLKNPTFRVILGEFHGTTQEKFDKAITAYPRMRDHYMKGNERPLFWSPLFSLYKTTADNFNATIVMMECAMKWNISKQDHPTVYPFVSSLTGSTYVMHTLWNKMLHKNNSDVGAIRCATYYLNFAYCDNPRFKNSADWNNPSYLATVVDSNSWVLLFLGVLLISFEMQFTKLEEWIRNILNLITVVLNTGPIRSENSKVFFLWTLCSTIFTTYYTGEITSFTIAPAPEESHSGTVDLSRNNFSFVFPSQWRVNAYNSTAHGFYKVDTQNRTDLNMNGEDTVNDMAALRELFTRKVILTDEKNMLKELIIKKKLASVASYQNGISYAFQAGKIASKIGSKKHCYIGKRVLPRSETFVLFSPPGGRILGAIHQRVIESGIDLYWLKEHFGIAYIDRVQDRARIQSPVKVIYEFEGEELRPLKMDGRVSAVFVIWVVGLAISLLAMGLELALRSRVVQTLQVYLPCSNKTPVVEITGG